MSATTNCPTSFACSGGPPQGGQCVTPTPVEEVSVAKVVTDMIPEVIPHSSAAPRKSEPEKIEWVSVENCDLTDWRLKDELQSVRGRDPPIVVVMGLARGYQIWALMSNGDCEELLSCRYGPVRALKQLPQPEPSFNVKEDAFSQFRPLLAICDSEFSVPGRQFCCVKFLSLQNGEQVHLINFDEPVSAIHVSQTCFVVTFSGKLVVCDTLSFEQQFWIRGCFKSNEVSVCPVSLGVNWLAFADTKLCSAYQSCGGVVVSDAVPAYATHVISAAKFDIHSCSEPVSGLVAHFPAHHDEPIGGIKLAPSASLLLTCGISGQCFHVFLVLPHPHSSTMAAVHHLYTLFRGSTPAKVQNVAFSLDIRWVAVTTNHGTTHLFPITPYGGPINMRTHGSEKVVNKDSRFFRSAGLDFLENAHHTSLATSPPKLTSDSPAGSISGSPQVNTPGGTGNRGSPITKELHPSLNPAHTSLGKVCGNTRLPPYPQPIVVHAADKIRQQFFGQIVNWTPDLSAAKKSTGHSSAAGGRPDDVQKFAGCFGRSRGLNPAAGQARKNVQGQSESLFLMCAEGRLTEHSLTVRPASGSSKVSGETQIEMTLEPVAQWTLERTKANPDIGLALPSDHLLIKASDICAKLNRQPQGKLKEDCAKPVEKNRSSSTEMVSSWISQVEMLTYAGPSRRLWMGPQFTFRTYLDPESTPTQLVFPSNEPGKKLLLKTGGSKKDKRSKPMAITPKVSQMLPSNSNRRSVPVVIEATSGSFDERKSAGVTMEVCGSWSDTDYISCDEQEGRVRESIAEAMRETATGSIASLPNRGPLSSDGVSCVDEDPSPMEDARSSFSSSPTQDTHLQFPCSTFDT